VARTTRSAISAGKRKGRPSFSAHSQRRRQDFFRRDRFSFISLEYRSLRLHHEGKLQRRKSPRGTQSNSSRFRIIPRFHLDASHQCHSHPPPIRGVGERERERDGTLGDMGCDLSAPLSDIVSPNASAFHEHSLKGVAEYIQRRNPKILWLRFARDGRVTGAGGGGSIK
jgi:hypothetical protein